MNLLPAPPLIKWTAFHIDYLEEPLGDENDEIVTLDPGSVGSFKRCSVCANRIAEGLRGACSNGLFVYGATAHSRRGLLRRNLSLHRRHAPLLDRRASLPCLSASAFSPNSSRRQQINVGTLGESAGAAPAGPILGARRRTHPQPPALAGAFDRPGAGGVIGVGADS